MVPGNEACWTSTGSLHGTFMPRFPGSSVPSKDAMSNQSGCWDYGSISWQTQCTQYPCNSNNRNVEFNWTMLNIISEFRGVVHMNILLSSDLTAPRPCTVATKPMRHRAGESKVDPAKSSHGRWALAASCISCIWLQKRKRFPLIMFMKNTNLMVGKCWKPPFVKSCLSSSHRRLAQALEDQQRFDTTRDKEELDWCPRLPQVPKVWKWTDTVSAKNQIALVSIKVDLGSPTYSNTRWLQLHMYLIHIW
jgi:hypothetical protein